MKTKTYKKWLNMKGASRKEGIEICDSWNKFENFLRDMGECPKGKNLSRLNTKLGFNPINCRWATKEEHSSSRKNNVFLIYDGMAMTISEWSRHIEIPLATIYWRYKQGMPLEKVLFKK